MKAVHRNYEQCPVDIQTKLSLKRTWSLSEKTDSRADRAKIEMG